MNDEAAAAKREKIQRMLAMQRKFIELDRTQGVDMQDYFSPEEGEPLHGFREEYNELAMEIVDAAHAIKGSKRD